MVALELSEIIDTDTPFLCKVAAADACMQAGMRVRS